MPDRPDRHSRRAFLIGALTTAGLVACSNDALTGSTTGTTGPGTTTGSGAATTGSNAVAGTAGAGTTATSTTGAPGGSSTTSSAGGQKPTTTQASQPTPTSGNPPAAPSATFVKHALTATDKVAFTFHTNGDLSLVQKLFDVVNDHHAVITCFVVGNWLEANPGWATRFTDAGHELANHTYTHPGFTTLSRSQMATEITKCRDVIKKLTGNAGSAFRPSGIDDGTTPFRNDILDEAGAAGYKLALGFDVDPLDYKDPGAAAVRDRTISALSGGAVISLHFGHPGTIEALPAILDATAAKKLEPVTVSRLFS